MNLQAILAECVHYKIAALINDDCDECLKQGGYELRFC